MVMSLTSLREQIDAIDDQLWQLILQRMELSRQVGEVKRQENMPIRQPNRFDELLQRRLRWAEQNGLSQEVVFAVCHALHEESVKVQMQGERIKVKGER